MTQMVYDAFRKQRELNLMLGLQSNVEIGGRSGFIFNTKHGRPIMPAGVNSFLKNIVNAYNKKESKLAEEEKTRAGADASHFIAYPSSYGMYQTG